MVDGTGNADGISVFDLIKRSMSNIVAVKGEKK